MCSLILIGKCGILIGLVALGCGLIGAFNTKPNSFCDNIINKLTAIIMFLGLIGLIGIIIFKI